MHMSHHSVSGPIPLPSVLIIGATGGFGRALARNLLSKGWTVKALTRHADMGRRAEAPGSPWHGLRGIDWHMGDAMAPDDVMRAAHGMQFVVHAANPPRYQRWGELALPMLASSMRAARESGARLVLPGNIYNFGPDAGHILRETSPQHPSTRKGTVRVEMEQQLARAASDPSKPLRSLVLRAGDYFGGHAPASWFSTLMVTPGRPLRRVVYPGRRGIGHSWAFLPDLAETAARLMLLDLQRPGQLSASEVVHFAGHWLPDGADMARAIARTGGRGGDLPIRALPWWLVSALSPFVRLLREINEMRYLWDVPLQLDNRRLRDLIGDEPHTPLDDAVRQSLSEMGCLHDEARGHPADVQDARA